MEAPPPVVDPEATGPFAALRSELGAAVAISIGMLIATGYALVWARLTKQDLPTENVLSTLPPTFFVGVALHAMVLSLSLTAILGTMFVLGERRKAEARFSEEVRWVRFVAGLWLLSILAALLGRHSFDQETGYYLGALLVLALSVLLALVIAGGVRRQSHDGRPALRLLLGATIFCCVFTASGVQVMDARNGAASYPLVSVLTTAPCNKLTGGVTPSIDRCRKGAFYIGESGSWIFVFQAADTCRPALGVRKAPPRFLSIKRESVEEMVVVSTRPQCADKDSRLPKLTLHPVTGH